MPLSGAASGRPLMIKSVPRREHRQVLLATFSRPNTSFPQLMSPFQATRRRNLRLGAAKTKQNDGEEVTVMPSRRILVCLEVTP
jgi:hypothetical protein